MAINTDDPNLYEHLSLITDAFEKSALRSGNRTGFLVAAHAPLSGINVLLDSMNETLARTAAQGSSAGRLNIDVDEDLASLVGNDDPDSAGSRVAAYLSECLNCDLRLKFDWQLQPTNLLGPIEALLNDLEKILNDFKLAIDPFKSLEDICNLLNALKGFCIPDLIMVLMSLKLLLKKYTLGTIEIHLDWTTILGPLLKVILDGVTALLNDLMSIMLAPLDCTIGGLTVTNQLEKEGRQALAGLENLFSSGVQITGRADTLHTDVGWGQDGVDIDHRLGGQPTPADQVAIPAGFDASLITKLDEALSHPGWADATFLEKLLVPLQEVKEYIRSLVGQLNKALQNLNHLTGGGLGIHLKNLGVLLFIADMISMVIMIIRMLKNHPEIRDWCTVLQQNPSLLEDELRARTGQNIRVENSEGDRLLLRQGSTVVGEIKTCASKRSELDSKVLMDWVKDLETRR